MKNKLLFLIHTEYHLLLATNYLYSNSYLFNNEYENIFLLNAGAKSKRLNKQLNFQAVPVKINYIDIEKNFNQPISEELRELLKTLDNGKFSEFNFFQEQDFFAMIILDLLKNKNTKINLFQDGLKPYVCESLGFTPSLHIQDFKINKYIHQNGYNVNDWFSSFRCHKYGFLKNIDNIYLTFPDSFPRKHSKKLNRLDFKIDTQLLKIYQNIFNWNEDLLLNRENVIFFMNQPMHDDGSFEMHVLGRLKQMYPDHPIIIKNHPLTPKEKIMQYKNLSNVTIIDSKIPAELFVATLDKSIIMSVCSTSMFVDNPSCSFYYLYNIKENNNIDRLKKYKVINPTSHVLLPERIEEIEFQ
jgi:hypothetical protein